MNKKILLTLALIVLISATISFSLLTRGHTWGDDFASYIMQAKSILHGTMGEFLERNAFTVDQSSYPPGPAAYPWGFPLLLAPVYATFGMNVLAFKLVNTFFYGLFLIAFFALTCTRLTKMESVLLTAVMAFNPTLLLEHDLILSDIPFLFFSTLGMFLIDKFLTQNPSFKTGLAIGFVIFAANSMRTNGVLLFVPLIVTQLIRAGKQHQDKTELAAWLKSALVPYLTFGLLFLVQTVIFPNGQDSYLSHFSLFSLPRLWDNFVYYLWLPSWSFDHIPGGIIFYPLLAIFVVVSILGRRSRDLHIYAYSLATLAVFILWPERQGLRFIYPILPFLFIFWFDGLNLAVAQLRLKWQKAARIVLITFWIALAVISLAVSSTFARNNLAANREINGPFDPVSAQMFEFVREKTPAESVVIFFKPRAMRLFTERDSFMTDRCEDLPKGNYLALSEKVGDNGQIPPEEVATCISWVSLEQVFNNRRFTIYKINK